MKTNVLFFTKGSETDKNQEENCTETVWVYDLRTNMPSFGKRTPFGDQHLTPFEAVYSPRSLNGRGAGGEGENPIAHPKNRTEGEHSFHSEEVALPESTSENEGIDPKLAHSRWRSFSRQWIAENKGDSLDISWLKDSDSVDALKGSDQPYLNTSSLGTFEIYAPELEKQTEIIHQVDQLFAHADRIEQQVNNALARVNNLTQSILAKAFRGEQCRGVAGENQSGACGHEASEEIPKEGVIVIRVQP